MNSQIRVSVIIPNYNYASYLNERIESILNQTFQDFELILLDDASTDNSAEILYKYQNNPHVTHILVNETNTGSPFQQWFKGISLAKGEYIWIAESDDLCEPSFLATTVRLLEKYPHASVAFTGSKLIDENGNLLPHDMNNWGKKKQSIKEKYFVFNGAEYATHNLYWYNYIANASAVVFRRSHLEQANLSQCKQMRYSGDWLFWFKLAMQGDIIEIYENLNYFRQHIKKVTTKAENNGGGKMEDIEIIYQMEKELSKINLYKRILRHGILYNRIKKLPISPERKQKLYLLLKEKLKSNPIDGHLAHINHFLRLICPFILTIKRDRI